MSGRGVGGSLAAEVEQRVIDLRRLDDTIGDDRVPAAHREWQASRSRADPKLFTGRRPAPARGDGELSWRVGWVESDAGGGMAVQHTQPDTGSAADKAGGTALPTPLFPSLAYQITAIGDPSDAALLAKPAARAARDATPVAKTLLLERACRPGARTRGADLICRLLETVDDTYETCSAASTNRAVSTG